MTARRLLATGLTAGLMLLATSPVFRTGPANAQTPEDRAPEFETFESAGGKSWRLADRRGRLVLLNFFSENCAHCREEIPVLNGLAKEYAGSLAVAGIAKDAPDPSAAAKLGKSFGCAYPVLTDGTDSKLSDAFHVYGLPHTVLVDETGTIEGVYRGIFPETITELKARIRDGRDRVAALHEAFKPGIPLVEAGPFEPKNDLAAQKAVHAAIDMALKAGLKGGVAPLLVVHGTVSSSERGSFVEYRIEDRRGHLWSGPETVKIRGDDFAPLVTAVREQLRAIGKQLE